MEIAGLKKSLGIAWDPEVIFNSWSRAHTYTMLHILHIECMAAILLMKPWHYFCFILICLVLNFNVWKIKAEKLLKDFPKNGFSWDNIPRYEIANIC